MRETSNPVFRSLPKNEGGYAQFGTGVAGAAQVGYQTDQYAPYTTPQTGVSRPLTIDDVVTKTGITSVSCRSSPSCRTSWCRRTSRLRCR